MDVLSIIVGVTIIPVFIGWVFTLGEKDISDFEGAEEDD